MPPARALVLLLALTASRRAVADDDRPEHAREMGGYFAVGTRSIATHAFAPVARVPRTLGGIGWGLPLVFGPFHLEGGLFVATADVPRAPGGFSLLDLQALAGWDVLRWDAVTAYVAGGGGIAAPGVDPRLVRAARSDGGNAVEVNPVATLHAGIRVVAPVVRIDRKDRLALALTVDGAYIRQVASGTWTQGTDARPVAGPNIDVSGTSMTLRLSILVLADEY